MIKILLGFGLLIVAQCSPSWDLFNESRGDNLIRLLLKEINSRNITVQPRNITVQPRDFAVESRNWTDEIENRQQNRCSSYTVPVGKFNLKTPSAVRLRRKDRVCFFIISVGNTLSFDCNVEVISGKIRINDDREMELSCSRKESPCSFQGTYEGEFGYLFRSFRRRASLFKLDCSLIVEDGTSLPSPSPPSPSPPSPSPPPPSDTCRCGTRFGDRIVGGEIAEPNSFPWQVSLSSNGQSNFCGGSIISETTILTAAHCADGAPAGSFVVIVSEHDFNQNDGQRIFQVSEVNCHPNYNRRTLQYDFCILKLAQPIDFSGENNFKAIPVCLPDGNDQYVGDQAQVTGWGTTSEGGSQSPQLRETTVTIISNNQCNQMYGGGVYSDMLCASAPGKDACQGDSGGPLVVNNNDQFELVGVVSWGFGCAREEFPGVYARVTHQIEWIKSFVDDENCDPN